MSGLSAHTEIEYDANVKIFKQLKGLWKWEYRLPLVPEHPGNIYCSCIERLCLLKTTGYPKSLEIHDFQKDIYSKPF